MEELMEDQGDDFCEAVLNAFANSSKAEWNSTGSEAHACSFLALEESSLVCLGKLQRFRDQGEAMCSISQVLRVLGRKSEATVYFQRARDIAEAHGFFSVLNPKP